MIKLILVDFDDTLCLSEESCFHLENEIAGKLGFPPMTRAAHQADWGQPLRTAITKRIPGIDAEKFMALFPEVSKKRREEGTFDQISDKNLAVLRDLRAKGYKVVIQTPRQQCEVKHLLFEGSPLMSTIDGFFYQERTNCWAPDPHALLLPVRLFNATPQETVYVGESFLDVEWCKAAGIHFIASIESGRRSKEDFAKVGATMVINTFGELPKSIEELNAQLAKEPVSTKKAIL